MPRLIAAVLILFSGATASAYEGELQGALELGYAHLAGDDPSGPGANGIIGLRYGLTDAWNLWAGGGSGLHPGATGTDGDTNVHVGALGGGIEWVFDVLQVVPWAGLGFEGLLFAADDTELAAAVQVSVGADYLLRRGLALGLVGRGRIVLSRLDEVPLQAIVALRLVVTLAD